MAVLFQNDLGYFISTEKFINNIYKNCEKSPKINPNLFEILSPFCPKKVVKKKCKVSEGSAEILEQDTEFFELQNDSEFVHKTYSEFRHILSSMNLLVTIEEKEVRKNSEALETAELVYADSGKTLIENSWGSNMGPPIVKQIKDKSFLFPENSVFYSKDVNDIGDNLKSQKFNLILLDPPWYNKYIKRKRKKNSAAYNMMSNECLKNLPIENLLQNTGLVVVWCTNCQNHLEELTKVIFEKWKVQFITKWYWVKITKSGEPVCNFSKPPGKQPFEQIIIAGKNPENFKIPPKKLIVSVPSAIHSNKPPLVDILEPFLPANAHGLEIFARNLLPKWTSYGNEVLRFQHESLYLFKNNKESGS